MKIHISHEHFSRVNGKQKNDKDGVNATVYQPVRGTIPVLHFHDFLHLLDEKLDTTFGFFTIYFRKS